MGDELGLLTNYLSLDAGRCRGAMHCEPTSARVYIAMNLSKYIMAFLALASKLAKMSYLIASLLRIG